MIVYHQLLYIKSALQSEYRLTFLAAFIFISSNAGKNEVQKKIPFFIGLFVSKPKLPIKFEKKVAIQSWYFHLMFERIVSHFPFFRSSRHKTRNFWRRERKKEKKLALTYINAVLRTALKRKKTHIDLHKCCNSHCIN